MSQARRSNMSIAFASRFRRPIIWDVGREFAHHELLNQIFDCAFARANQRILKR
jgi:hypothetical protein